MTRARALFFVAFAGTAAAGCADILGLDPLGPALFVELPDGALAPIDGGFVPEPAPTTPENPPDPGVPDAGSPADTGTDATTDAGDARADG